jgi:hypothetical protein
MIRFSPFILALIFLLALVLTVPGLAADQPTAAAPEPADSLQNLNLTTNVIAGSDTIRNGDVVTYTVNLSRGRGDGSLRVDIDNVLPSPLRLAGRVTVNEIQPEVHTGDLQVTYGRDRDGNPNTRIRWQGRLSANAEVQLLFPVEVYSPCQSGRPTERVNHTVRAYPFEGDMISASTSYIVTCPQVSLDDILVALEIVDGNKNGRNSQLASFEYPDFLDIQLRVTMTNRAEERAIVGYHLAKPYIGETEKQSLDHNGLNQRDHLVDMTQIILGAGETRTFSVWTDMRPLSHHLNRLEENGRHSLLDDAPADDDLLVNFDLHYLLLPYIVPNLQVDLDGSLEIATTNRQLRLRTWDFGDAPDSSNHFGLAMTAYPGVTANFPTVYNPAVSAVPGPAHARPHHFHLGRGVDVETDADLGAAPNIDPASDTADLDQFDDGANPHNWNLTHCRPTRISVQIYISREAASWFRDNRLTGYLNGWLDGNRDGDWADTVTCAPDDLPLPGVALEHFIIDHKIDVVALGPGYHTINVRTGRVPWPADKADQQAWVRLTLSERPSAKIDQEAGIEYGDGRGHERPFRTGETEDYLLRPPGSPGTGPDMAVTMRGDWRSIPLTNDLQAQSAFTYQKIEWTWSIDYTNQGTATAENVELLIEFSEDLNRNVLEERLYLVAPRRDAQTIYYTISDNLVTVSLGRVEPSERGSIVLKLGGDEVFPLGGDELFPLVGYEAKTTVVSDQDVRPDNNTTAFKVEIEGVTQGAFEFKSPNAPFPVQQGTTNSPDITLQGFYQDRVANESFVTIWVHRLLDAARTDMDPGELYEVPVDDAGRWSLMLSDLDDGFYQFAVGDPAACDTNPRLAGNDNEWRYSRLHGYGTVCGLAVVDTSLHVDPISMVFTDGNSRTFLMDDTLYWREGDWGARLPQGEYTVTMSLKGDFNEAFIGITGFGSFETKKLTETEIPGRYETNFIIGDGGGMPTSLSSRDDLAEENSLSLLFETDDEEIAYTGGLDVPALGQVEDATTGQAVPAASVLLLTAWEHDDTAVFLAWDGSEYDQANPVVSDDTGAYALLAPDEPYQLYLMAPGYQPYRTGILNGGGVVTQTVALAPELGAADYVIGLTAAGFEPAVSAVKPDSVVQFVNSDSIARRIVGDGFDSGLLRLGESFSIQVGAEGLVLFRETTNPAHTGTLLVDPLAGQSFIYLPLVIR